MFIAAVVSVPGGSAGSGQSSRTIRSKTAAVAAPKAARLRNSEEIHCLAFIALLLIACREPNGLANQFFQCGSGQVVICDGPNLRQLEGQQNPLRLDQVGERRPPCAVGALCRNERLVCLGSEGGAVEVNLPLGITQSKQRVHRLRLQAVYPLIPAGQLSSNSGFCRLHTGPVFPLLDR